VANGHGDDQADDGVRRRPAQGHPGGADQDGQAGEPVGAGVQPIGDQGGAADAPADPDAIAGHDLVAREPG
jgi:hypothetical protein